MDSARSGPLDGLKVLDASNIIAGPFCGMVLGDFGADVIKLEHPETGDPLRHHAPIVDGAPLMWKMLARNKKSVTCDFNDDEHRAAFLRVCDGADVVILTFRPTSLAKWGIDPETLIARNPRLVVATVSGFGEKGPLADAAGFGTLAEAMSGFAYRNGFPDAPPVLPPFGLADSVAGMNLALGVLLALEDRHRVGRGQHVSVSLVEPLMAVLQPQNSQYAANGVVAGRTGSRATSNAPRGLYECADGLYVAISTSTNTTAIRLLQHVGGGDIASEEWFAQPYGRAQHADDIDEVLQPWFKERNAADAVEELQAAHIPVAPVHNAATMATDPQLLANESLVRVEDGDRVITMPNVHIHLSRSPGEVRWAGPDQPVADIVEWESSGSWSESGD